MLKAINGHPFQQQRFLDVAFRHKHGMKSIPSRQIHHGKDAWNRAKRAVKRQLANDQEPVQARQLDLSACGKQADGDSQIKRCTFLANIGRRKIDRYSLHGKGEPAVFDRRSYPFNRLPDRRIRKSHHRGLGNPARQIDLYFNHNSINTVQTCAGHFAIQHKIHLLPLNSFGFGRFKGKKVLPYFRDSLMILY